MKKKNFKMNNIKKFEDFLDRMQGLLDNAKEQGHLIVRVEDLENTFPELKESEDEKISKVLIDYFKRYKEQEECGIKTFYGIPTDDILAWLEKQKQDDLTNYKKTLSNYDEAEKEKCDFVGDGFIKCYADFQDFKEGETYWFEYIGDDKYNVRSDNLLGKTYHITPCQLYTIFKKQTWLEKQGEQKFADKIEPKFHEGDWNEDDEYMLDETIQHLEELIRIDKAKHCACDVQFYQRDIDWLKSIKERMNND